MPGLQSRDTAPQEHDPQRAVQDARFASGLPGGPGDPLGARALYLYRGGHDTMYRIHGSNGPTSVAVSNGCIRLLNAHFEDLYIRVSIGTPVYIQ